MSTLRRFSFALTGIVILSLLLVLSTADQERAVGAPASSTQNVNVVNTTANPVPTAAQGTTSISGTVSVGNSPSVSITGTPTVNLATGASVRDADNPARQPFQVSGEIVIPPGSQTQSSDLTTAPPGKRLVIELVTAEMRMQTGQKARVNLSIGGNGGAPRDHFLTLTPQGTFLFGAYLDVLRATQPMRVYADPGIIISWTVDRSDTTGGAIALIDISGYFVDVP